MILNLFAISKLFRESIENELVYDAEDPQWKLNLDNGPDYDEGNLF